MMSNLNMSVRANTLNGLKIIIYVCAVVVFINFSVNNVFFWNIVWFFNNNNIEKETISKSKKGKKKRTTHQRVVTSSNKKYDI